MNKITKELQFNPFSIKKIRPISKQNRPAFLQVSITGYINKNFNRKRYDRYNLETYKYDIKNLGIRCTWELINNYLLNFYNPKNEFLTINNLSKLYEYGLSIENKDNKKTQGQYYTPNDVAYVMADLFKDLKGKNICDVACGTGNLILTFLDLIGGKNTIDIIKNNRLYLYDSDDIALNICKTILYLKFGKDLCKCINFIKCDFLSKSIVLPSNCKVICNPPYSITKQILGDWDKTEISIQTKELYAMFIEKIIKQSESSVIISPYSFLVGRKFYSLRKLMNEYNGFIISFDNVPGSIFCGKKHGIFNTNTSNSVRASITVVENLDGRKGFRVSPLIRFKNIERKNLLKSEVLKSFLNDRYQIISNKQKIYIKCFKELEMIWNAWQNKGTQSLKNFISNYGQNVLSMPNTCRYYTTAFNGILNRRGQIILNFENEDVFYFVFCLINSSFAYWYWRLFDGGITYPKGLLLNMPLFFESLTKYDKIFFKKTALEMIEKASLFMVMKNNIGIQENIKYPREYRDKINRKLLDILGLNINERIFDIIHSNMALEVNV